MNRLDARFAALKAEDRAAFIAYMMAGDPDLARSEAILAGLPAAGADIIELGFPFSDPMAEGVPIQLASQRALAAQTTLAKTLDVVRRFRGTSGATDLSCTEGGDAPDGDGATPIVLMGYLNPVLSYGFERFARDAAEAGVDGLIVVDCPPEEADPLADALDAAGIALIRLTAPTTDDARLAVVARRTSGFVYYVSVAGVTGTKEADAAAVAPAVARVRAATGLPVAVGFGIRTPQRAAEVARVADAAVVGSALVDEIAAAEASGGDAVRGVLDRARGLAEAVRTARVKAESI
jgi:tryptophan synthase alpha chain